MTITQYRLDYADDDQGAMLIPCVKYDYTGLEHRFVNVSDLLDILNECTSDTAYDRVMELIHDLTKAVPGSD
jgi:hypothetical protein